MKFLILLALKNLTRYKKRTLITASALAAGLMIFIFLDGWLLGAEQDSERNLIWYETSSARIMHQKYWDKFPQVDIDNTIENYTEILEELDERGVSAAPRITFNGNMIVRQPQFPDDGSFPVRIVAIDPQRDDDVFRFKDTVDEGRYLEADKDEVLIGSWLAEDIGAEVGSQFQVEFSVSGEGNQREAIFLEVAGIVTVPNPNINRGTIFIPLDVAQWYLVMPEAVTEINLDLGFADAPERAQTLEDELSLNDQNLVLEPWQEIAGDYVLLATMKQAGSKIYLFLVLIIAAVGISNTMLMSIFERVRELGMMRALGMEEGDIRKLFLLEAAGIGLLGSIMGCIIGILINIPMVQYGIDFSFITRDMDIGYRIASVMYSAWNPFTIIIAFISGIVFSVFIAIWPTRKALHMKITDCLTHQ